MVYLYVVEPEHVSWRWVCHSILHLYYDWTSLCQTRLVHHNTHILHVLFLCGVGSRTSGHFKSIWSK